MAPPPSPSVYFAFKANDQVRRSINTHLYYTTSVEMMHAVDGCPVTDRCPVRSLMFSFHKLLSQQMFRQVDRSIR